MPRRPPVWILSWDGAAPWLLERALAAGATPNVARLRARGATAAGSVSDNPDCTTPPGHATLWTGFPARDHGVTSFRVPSQPPKRNTLLQFGSGFDSRLMLKEPIWVTAARAGLRSTLVHTPISSPFEPWTEKGRFGFPALDRTTIVHGYGEMRCTAAVLSDPPLAEPRGWKGVPHPLEGAREFSFRAKPLNLSGLLLQGPKGFDRAWIVRDRTRGREGVLVEAGPAAAFSAPMPISERAGVVFRLFDLAPDGSRMTLFRSDGFDVESWPEKLGAEYLAEVGPFTGGGSYRCYGEDSFGPRYADGRAENLYMATHLRGMDHFKTASAWAVDKHPADLMIFYHPGIDELGHLWAGYVQDGEPCHDPAKARLVGPCFLEAYRKADEHLGALLDRLPADGTLILTSDHGVNGIRRHFLPNVVLRAAGLLATKAGNDYQIDLARTKALYHPANNNYVFLNTKDHRLGWLPEAERDATLEAVRECLTRFVDPETGQPVLAAAIRIDHLPADSELRGQGRGDLFLAVKPGYSLGDSLHQQALVPADLAGHHQQHPGYRPVHGIFECVGPRIRPGKAIGVIGHRDIHETMRHLLGLPPSGGGGESLGRILEQG